MKKTIYILIIATLIFSCDNKRKEKVDYKEDVTQILVLGTLHFNQFHNTNSVETDFAGINRQKEFRDVVSRINKFEPDAVLIEREPQQQGIIDSLFNIENLNYDSLSDGMSEAYQIGFRLAKANNLKSVFGVDYYEAIPQDLIETGINIEIFKDSLKAFQNKGRGITKRFLTGELDIIDFLIELNKKENIEMSHRLIFNTPAYVVDGSFKRDISFDEIDEDYIGAEYISLFYERNLKIYSNILNLTKKSRANRIVLIIGQVHVGVLHELLNKNPNFKIVEANEYLESN